MPLINILTECLKRLFIGLPIHKQNNTWMCVENPVRKSLWWLFLVTVRKIGSQPMILDQIYEWLNTHVLLFNRQPLF